MSVKFEVSKEKNIYELSELSKMFGETPEFCVVENSEIDRNEEKRNLYHVLSQLTGKELDWGILTGVRPGKLFRELADKNGKEEAIRILKDVYLLSNGKIQLLVDTYDIQQSLTIDKGPSAISLYVGIPFCPTTCLYCSFTSNAIAKWKDKVDEYIECLKKEIDYLEQYLHLKKLSY
ncbi:MAG: coproporphyrinogen dehydrogenase HemZ, partial [Bacillota bacterium]|nr:coproporphyrinogen dehydrogenase HemZ [Bacillota bacterium]